MTSATAPRQRLGWLLVPLIGAALLAGPVLAAEGAHKGPSELLFVAQLLALMLVGRLLGEVMLRIGQPAVMGQLIAGLILGPSLFGALAPEWHQMLFPKSTDQKAMLDAVSQVGVLLLLLLTGMETDLKLVRQTGWASASASLFGIVIPFVCGVALGWFIPESLLDDPAKRLITALFLGTALSIASVKIVATVITEMNFMRRTVGQVILASAIIDDTIGWMITAVIFGLAQQGQVDPWSVGKSLIGTIAFMGLSLTIGRRVVFIIIRWVNDTFVSDFAVITAILLIMIAMSIVTDLIGVHTVLGAFVAGILVGESPILTKHIDEQLRGLIFAFFMPVFFGAAGLSADLTILKDPVLFGLTAGLIAIASIGKFGGASLGGLFGGLTQREALALGCGMNARGSTEVIVATIGLSMGALSHDLFTMIVTMAVVTTMAMPPTLRWSLKRLPMRKEEKKRLEREELESRGFVRNLERLLLVVDDSANGKFVSRTAGMLAGTHGMPTTVLHIADAAKIEKPTEPAANGKNGKSTVKAAEIKSETKKSEKIDDKKKTTKKRKAEEKKKAAETKIEEKKAEETKEVLEEAAAQIKKRQKKEEKVDTPVDVTTIVHEAPDPDFISEEAKKGYDLMLVGLAKASDEKREFHRSIADVSLGFEGPLAVAATRGELAKTPDGDLSILVPVNGTEQARRGAEIALTIARATKAPLSVLYVAQRPSKRGLRRALRSRRHEEAILKDIVAIADGYNMSIRTAVVAEKAADEAIRAECKRRKHNLVVLGVAKRPGEKLFFGDTAASLLEKADVSLLFVAS